MSQTVLITGASVAIGSAIAKSFALEGYHVLLHYNRDEDAVKKLCSLINESGFHAYCVKADLLNADDVKSLAQKANDACIDVLINNAGISDTLLFSEQNFENISRVINLDLTSAMQLTSLIIPMMINRKSGNIINISSMWGECGGSCEVVYSAAKAGLIGFTKALAKELGPSGIRVNCITPGVMNAGMSLEHSDKTLKDLAESTPLKRLGEVSDIANGALFLASMKSDFITGEILKINGGFFV